MKEPNHSVYPSTKSCKSSKYNHAVSRDITNPVNREELAKALEFAQCIRQW